MSSVRVFAPAKINLFLHVVGRRPDGYHLLETAFRMLAHGDWITLTRREDGAIHRTSTLAGVAEESDLVVRAARLMQTRTNSRFGVDIAVEKKLPMGGGLGGGSSDAASVMLGLNRLWGLGIGRETLQQWGLTLGADVPFFLFGQSAFAQGVGEKLQPLSLPPACYVVVEPPVAVPTGQIFTADDLTRDTEPTIIARFPELPTRNDLELVARRLFPEVDAAIEMLGAFGEARMSGSGSSVFLRCADASEARKLVAKLPSGTQAWIAESLDRHPLFDWADSDQ
ncbi:4-(cytidine 5'-diphospho)-2-C-methyl-D-erythritol kinase [Niveibacterium terrae]|uniref:4-(cytidine 5'-diphospho)-2-C-methyl-D-erythritol kinase n=1 Tax=Niveibacterium terrae TaxID=3373598 RepID=UPI003A8E1906